MTKQDLLNQIAKATGLRYETAAIAVEGFLKVVIESVEKGETITLRGFGNFYAEQRASRKAQFIAQGETITVPAKMVPIFRASKEFKNRIKTMSIIPKAVIQLAKKDDLYVSKAGEVYTVYEVTPMFLEGQLVDYLYGIYRESKNGQFIKRNIKNNTMLNYLERKEVSNG